MPRVLLLTLALSSLSGAAVAENTDATQGSNAKNIAAIEPALTGNGASASAPVQGLSLFGVLALGIIGLLWVRRHTSEL